MSSRALLRMLGILLFTIAGPAGCVEPDDDRGPETAAAARSEADPGFDALVASLRSTGVQDYDTRLGDLDWGNATLDQVGEAGHQVVVVPIVNGARSRFLIAGVVPGRDGPAFRTVVLEFTLDPATGELAGDIAARNADGTARAIAAPGNFAACVLTTSNNCLTNCGVNLSCLLPCVQGGIVGCFVQHVILPLLFSW